MVGQPAIYTTSPEDTARSGRHVGDPVPVTITRVYGEFCDVAGEGFSKQAVRLAFEEVRGCAHIPLPEEPEAEPVDDEAEPGDSVGDEPVTDPEPAAEPKAKAKKEPKAKAR